MKKMLRRGAAITISGIGLASLPFAQAWADDPIKPFVPKADAPGVGGLQDITNMIVMYALIACGVGFVGGVIAMVVGPAIGMHQGSKAGKMAIFISIGAAFLLGIGSVILNTAWNIGKGA